MNYICVLLLLFMSFDVSAKETNPFIVNDVKVYAKTGDLTDSKTLAISNGSQKALTQLILSLNANSLESAEHKNTLRICIENLKSSDKLLQDYVVKSERMTSKSYGATMDFVFDKKSVESIMNTCGLKYASVSPGNVLLIPIVFELNEYRMLDSEVENEFFTIMTNIKPVGLLNFKILLNKNIIDVSDIDPEIIRNSNYKDIERVLQNHHCSRAIVILLKAQTKNSATFEVRVIAKNDVYHDTFSYKITANESYEAFLKRSIYDILNNVDLVWKRGFESKKQMVFNSGVTFEMSTPNEWRKIGAALNTISIIKEYKFKTISGNTIDLELKYVDSPEILSQRLLENGIAIFKKNDKTIMKLIKQNNE